MTVYYKSLRYVEGKVRWVVEDEYGNINKSPTNEKLKIAMIDDSRKKTNFKGRKCCMCGTDKTYMDGNNPKWHTHECDKKGCTRYICYNCYLATNKSYKEERICCKCGNKDTYLRPNGSYLWYRDYDDKRKWTKKWICHKCHMISYHKLPNSDHNIIKEMAQCRNGKFDIKKERCRGCIGVNIVIDTLRLKDLNIEMDNFNYYVDTSEHSEYGLGEVKTGTLNKIRGIWTFHDIKPENCDTVFLVCMDENELWENVEQIYIIPSEYIDGTSVTITKSPSPSRRSKWEIFRIDEKSYNNTYHNMKIGYCFLKSKIKEKRV